MQSGQMIQWPDLPADSEGASGKLYADHLAHAHVAIEGLHQSVDKFCHAANLQTETLPTIDTLARFGFSCLMFAASSLRLKIGGEAAFLPNSCFL
jgi:hypothetical protein